MSVVRRRKTNRRKKTPRDWRTFAASVMRITRDALLVVALGGLTWVAIVLLDRPIASVSVDGPFQRVTAVQLEGVIRPHLGGGVLSADLDAMRAAVRELAWVDRVSVARRWPDGLRIEVTEQLAAARWGEHGLLNTRGELFVREARHVPAELPQLSGPEGTEWEVAQRYLAMRDRLLAAGFGLRAVSLDARGAWRVELANGIEVRLGREESDLRIERFVTVVAPLIAGAAGGVRYVDMRYSHGFAIGWDQQAPSGDGNGDSTDA